MSSWDDYFWEPGADVLRNFYGIRNKWRAQWLHIHGVPHAGRTASG